jgi:mono/diheme cytochrome c family protein
MRFLRWFVFLVVVGGLAGLWITRPLPLPDDALSGVTGDADAGRLVFAAAGCASCHTAPESASLDLPVLAGGMRFASAFGTFIAPNISADPVHGIGGWTDLQIASAVMRGVGVEGEHLYPAFPYASYRKATMQDVADLIAYLRTLPSDPTPSQAHEIAFPFNIRSLTGVWKILFMSPDWVVTTDLTPEQSRGRYLVEALGGLERDQWLSGAPNPTGKGRVPNITPNKLTWSEGEIAEYLNSGFTPEFDTAGGDMADVVMNIAQLLPEDRAAIAAYLKIVPPIASASSN